jgi:hypothetical protein
VSSSSFVRSSMRDSNFMPSRATRGPRCS